jgi:hypothetical protein
MLFGKWGAVVLSVFCTIIYWAMIIQVTKEQNTILRFIYEFLNSWAGALNAAAATLLILTEFIKIGEDRRAKATESIKTWAKDAIRDLNAAYEADSPDSWIDECQRRILVIYTDSLTISPDAKQISKNELSKKVCEVSNNLKKLIGNLTDLPPEN